MTELFKQVLEIATLKLQFKIFSDIEFCNAEENTCAMPLPLFFLSQPMQRSLGKFCILFHVAVY